MKVALRCTRQGLGVNNGNAVTNELMNTKRGDEPVDECITVSETKLASHRGSGTSKLNAHQVSYLAASGGDSRGVHHVRGDGWRRLSAIMDSGSAECVAPESIPKSVPLNGN